MGDKNKTGKPPITKTSYRNNNNGPPRTPPVKNTPTNIIKQIPSYSKLSNPNTNQNLYKSNSINVSVDKNATPPPHPPTATTTTINDALQITAAANHHDNLSISDNHNVSVDDDDNSLSQSATNLKPPSSFATITANEKTPSREQAIVFNSIDGIRQLEYILAIGKLIPPRDIIFTSRISNNRFCIFFSRKEVLETLLEKSKTISINEHIIPIRRLINPAKKITISNVCPSIPNQVILNALKNLNITPVSHINHIKAGINVEGYEHIMSFRRQMFINQDDIIKLPGSLSINSNQTAFRIFFTDDRITCFLCKAVGHTSATCSNQTPQSNTTTTHTPNNPQIAHSSTTINVDHSIEQLEDIQPPELPPIDTTQPQSIMDWSQENHDKIISQPIEYSTTSHTTTETPITTQVKRPLSDTNTLKSPTSPTASGSSMPLIQPEKKKAKTSRSRSNSLSSTEDNKINTALQPTVAFFSDSVNTSINLDQFKYFLENIRNPSVNIHTLCDEINSSIPDMFEITEKIRPLITDRAMKTKLKILSNLLFKTLPPN